MGLKPKLGTGGDGKFKVDAGQYRARCVQVCDLGMQEHEYKGEKKQRHQVWLGFALENEQEKGMIYTCSLSDNSHLYKAVNMWMYGGKMVPEDKAEFTCDKLLGEYCTLHIVSNKSSDGTHIAMITCATGPEDFAQDVPLVLVDEGQYLKGDESMVPPFISAKIDPASF